MNIPPGSPQRPWRIQIEPVKGCNRSCWFCGVLVTDRRTKKYADLDMLRELYHQLNAWLPRVRTELDSAGEPTLHPQLFEMIRVIRQEMPSTSISVLTNCEPWRGNEEEFVQEFFAAGGNTLQMDTYQEPLYEWWLQNRRAPFLDGVEFYVHEERGCPNPYYYCPPTTRRAILIAPLDLAKRPHTVMHNVAGASNVRLRRKHLGVEPLQEPLRLQCDRPYREINVLWDGTVPMCCTDIFLHWQPMGNVSETPVKEIWESPKFQAIRYLLSTKEGRTLIPCRWCDQRPKRPGLLPKMGELPGTIEELTRFVQPSDPWEISMTQEQETFLERRQQGLW